MLFRSLFALSSEEGHCNKECASEADGKLDVSHIKDAADDETWDEHKGILCNDMNIVASWDRVDVGDDLLERSLSTHYRQYQSFILGVTVNRLTLLKETFRQEASSCSTLERPILFVSFV